MTWKGKNLHGAAKGLRGKGKGTHGLQIEKDLVQAKSGTSIVIQEI